MWNANGNNYYCFHALVEALASETAVEDEKKAHTGLRPAFVDTLEQFCGCRLDPDEAEGAGVRVLEGQVRVCRGQCVCVR